jgi:hypothetical protein
MQTILDAANHSTTFQYDNLNHRSQKTFVCLVAGWRTGRRRAP